MTREIRKSLAATGVRPTKQRGQNFVVNPSVINQIIEFGGPGPSETILEIGPGLGALTEALLTRVDSLTVIELEPGFCAELANKFPTIKIIQGDARQANFSEIGADLTVFGNLPYVFSTEIITKLIAERQLVRRALLLLQREFAERLASPPGGRTYGSISVGCQLWADMRLGPIISGDSFYPTTKVQSRLIELTFLQSPRVNVVDERWFRRIVQGSFLKRRKQLHNSLKGLHLVPPNEIDDVLILLKIDPVRRPETLSLQEFADLANELYERVNVEKIAPTTVTDIVPESDN